MPVFERQRVKVEADVAMHLDMPSVRVDEQGLSLDGALVLARADISSVSLGLYERTTVHMRTRKRTGFSCTFTDSADAHALLEALGRTPERTTLEVQLESSLLAPGFEALPLWKGVIVVSLAIVAFFALFPLMSRPSTMGRSVGSVLDRTLDLGADGIRIRGRFANAFMPYREISSVASRDGKVVFTLHDGTERVLAVSLAARVADVVRRVELAIAEANVPEDDEVAALLHEVPGTTAEKVAALRELGTEASAYREARPPRERLWGIVEDPRVNGATRARAAIALSGALAGDERERLRIATDATVSPKVRIAMDAVGHENDDLLAERLEALPEEPANAQARRSR